MTKWGYVWEYNGRLIHLHENEIYYVHSEQGKVFAHTRNEIYEIGDTMSRIVDSLTGMEQVRPHYSYVVNLKYIKQLDAEGLVLRNGVRIPLCRKRKPGVFELVRSYCE